MITAAIVLTAGLALFLTTPTVLRHLPTPQDEPSSPYRPLATRRVAAWTGATTTAMTWAALHTPPTTWPVWLPLATVTTLAVCLDELTCWLPKALTHTTTTLALTALAITWTAGALPTSALLRCLLAGLAVRSLFWLLWRLAGTMGFGDVRLSLLCGMGAGLAGWHAVFTALMLGTLLPVVEALLVHRGTRHIPYGPGLLLGALAATLW